MFTLNLWWHLCPQWGGTLRCQTKDTSWFCSRIQHLPGKTPVNRLDTEAAEAKPEVRSGLSGLHFFLTAPPGEEREASKDCGQASAQEQEALLTCYDFCKTDFSKDTALGGWATWYKHRCVNMHFFLIFIIQMHTCFVVDTTCTKTMKQHCRYFFFLFDVELLVSWGLRHDWRCFYSGYPLILNKYVLFKFKFWDTRWRSSTAPSKSYPAISVWTPRSRQLRP